MSRMCRETVRRQAIFAESRQFPYMCKAPRPLCTFLWLLLLGKEYVMDSNERDFFLAVLLAVLSKAVNTIGKQFAQPMKVRDSQGNYKHKLGQKAIADRRIDLASAFIEQARLFCEAASWRSDNQAVRSDYRETLKALKKGDVSLIYADPPYSRYHYSRYYHVLETIALYDDPSVSNNPATNKTSRGIYRTKRHQSPFSIKTQAKGAFQELFALSVRLGCPLLLSYSPFPSNRPATPRMIAIDELVAAAKPTFIRPWAATLR